MAKWKEITGPGETWKYENVGDTVVGILESVESGVGPNNSMMYTLRQENGETIGVWGNTVIDGRLGKLPIGTNVKIEYLGKTKSPKTNREYNNFKFYQDEEQPPLTQPEPTPPPADDTDDLPFDD
jgi:hypothetical protein